MRAKSFALLVLALGCGLVASIGITQVMSKEETPVVETGDTETVFVALEDVGLGETLEANKLRMEQWPKDKVPEGALTKIEDVEGRRTKTKLYAGEPIMGKKLRSKGDSGGGVSDRVPPGYRLVSVRVDSVTGIHGMILPGDRVDVQLYVAPSQCVGAVQSGVHTILQDIKVFACNDVIEPDETEGATKSIKAQTISLLATPEQAKKVQLAGKLGEITLVMRGWEQDTIETNNVPVTARDLFGNSDSADRDKEIPDLETDVDQGPADNLRKLLERFGAGGLVAGQQQPPPLPNPTADTRQTYPMRIVRGSEIEHVFLEAEPGSSGTGTLRWRQVGVGGVAAAAPFGNLPGLTPSDRQTPDPQAQPQQPDQSRQQPSNDEETTDDS